MDRARRVVAAFTVAKVTIRGRASRRVLRPGGSVHDHVTISGLGRGKRGWSSAGTGRSRRAQRSAARARPSLAAALWSASGAYDSPEGRIPKAGIYAYQASVAGERTPCGVRAQGVLGRR